MKDGDKIKWVYLKKNPLGLETTAFTGHNDPPQINQFVQQYIDYNKIWKQDLENKLDDFYAKRKKNVLIFKLARVTKIYNLVHDKNHKFYYV